MEARPTFKVLLILSSSDVCGIWRMIGIGFTLEIISPTHPRLNRCFSTSFLMSVVKLTEQKLEIEIPNLKSTYQILIKEDVAESFYHGLDHSSK